MLLAKVRPSTVVFNNLISGLSRSGHAHRAFKYFNDLKKRDLPPSNHTYASLFRAFTEMGPSSRPLLEKVVSEVDRRDFLLNTIATNSLMVAMTTCGMTDEVFGAYGDMSRRREAPDVNTFTVLLTACSQDQTRGMERVEHVWREMTALGVTPDLV
ncbi:Pentatricopeptide repeat-containing protein 1, mitochondrial, partial [Geodia barretti]